ncbi:uncharacterized protein (DUF1499 family) [Methylohalomonas lacus]|uniref:Uncharacterized protein (DUF1499 family) n=1 Tax=Methylohalomonas lacus TaxID=398773 RepID=A0AAE3L3S4_9GAMM|nr:DUF1499 domain-containing protein [Methylohalomonas lacus]MCS3902663.1 uncharacterized protein (DUF1499 family) [Methylohalomonas lacus]
MLLISGFGTQLNWWDFRIGFIVLRYGAYLGLVSAILAAAATVAMLLWHRLRNFIIVNILVVVVGLVTVAVPYSWQQQARSVPTIHDISTDLDDPPEFVDIAPLRADAPNPVEYAGADTAEAQREAYPGIQPLYFDAPVEHVFRAAEQAVADLDWELIAADEDAGRIEVTDTTRWFGFKDDVVIRIQPDNDRTRLDMRSKSRVGKSDVGTNAARIRTFLEVMRIKLPAASQSG